jgi:hypothetical protein
MSQDKQKLDAALLVFAAVCAALFWLLFYLWSLSMSLVNVH